MAGKFYHLFKRNSERDLSFTGYFTSQASVMHFEYVAVDFHSLLL